MRQLVLVLGAGGQLGDALVQHLGGRHEIVARTRAELDVTDADALRADIEAVYPDVLINCAADTDVDGAEDHPVATFATNAWAVRSLARAAAEIDATLVHFSTDFVFDGATDRPYVETDQPNPRGAYAISKLVGEWLAADAPRHYVLRVESLFGGHRANSSVDHLLDGIREGREVRAFADRTVSPSYVADVADVTRRLIERTCPYGLYHCVNTGWTTWLELAHRLADLAGRPGAAIVPVEMAQSGLKAPRPRFAALANANLANLRIEMPTWEDALERYVKKDDQ